MPIKWSTFVSLSVHVASGMSEMITDNAKKHILFCRNIETLLPLQQQLTLYMYTSLPPEGNIFTLSLILSFRDRQNWDEFVETPMASTHLHINICV